VWTGRRDWSSFGIPVDNNQPDTFTLRLWRDAV
jgi:hypothetical protein